MKYIFTFSLLSFSFFAKAQKIDSMYVHLYTDSLKKGTFNYINVDGLLSNGNWMPLDSNHVEFKCSAGEFFGNQLWVDTSFAGEKISIDAILRSDRSQRRHFDMYIKKQTLSGPLPTEQEVLNNGKKKKKNNR